MPRGLLLSEGDVHRRNRSLISPSFTFAKLQGMAPLIARAAARACRALAAPGGAPIDAHERMSNLTLYIIGLAAFGAEFEGLLPTALVGGEEAAPPPRVAASAADAAGVHKSLAFLLDYMLEMISNPLLLLPGGDALPLSRKAARLIGDLRGLAGGMIAARRAARAAASAAAAAANTEPDDLLDALLDAEGGAGFSAGEVLDEALTFVLAGHETTAKALSWSLLLLAQHPAWAARVRSEAAVVLGPAPAARLPTRDDVPRLPLLAATVQEALRLYPPAPVVARECVRDVELAAGSPCALRVAAGTTLLIPVAALQRDEALWEEPHAFKPERWLLSGDEADAPPRFSATACLKHPLAFAAFSHGPRNCIGAGFAQLEAKLILAVLVSRLEWEVLDSYQHMPNMAITLRPLHGMPMVFRALGGAPPLAPRGSPKARCEGAEERGGRGAAALAEEEQGKKG